MRYLLVLAACVTMACGGGDGDNSRSQIRTVVPWMPEEQAAQPVAQASYPTVERTKTVMDCVEVRDQCWRDCGSGGVLPDGQYVPIDQCSCRCTATYWTCRSELADPGLR